VRPVDEAEQRTAQQEVASQPPLGTHAPSTIVGYVPRPRHIAAVAPPRSRRPLLLGLLAAGMVAALLYIVIPRRQQEALIPPAPPLAGNILHELGTIEALSEAFVLTRFSGDIIWKIEEGTFVEPGEPVVKFETRTVEEDIEGREKDLVGKQEAVRRAQADIELARKKFDLQIRQQEIALEVANLDRDRTYGYPREDEKLDVELSLKSAEQEFKRAETDAKGIDELADRAFVSEANRRKKQVELAQKKINFSKAKLIRDLTLQGLSSDSKRLADMSVADAKKRLQITKFNREQDLAVMRANLELAQIDLTNFERELDRKRKELKLATVRAASRGRVAFVDVWKGSRALSPIQVGETRQAGGDLCKICDTSGLRIALWVNESDIVRLRLKQKAEVKLSAFPGRTFTAVVSEVGAVASDKNGAISGLAQRSAGEAFVNVVGVKLDFTDLAEQDRRDIRIGFTTDVFIDLGSVPDSGVETSARGDQKLAANVGKASP